MCRENEELIAKLSVPPEGSKDLFFKSAYPQSQLTQTRLLLKKDLITYWRSPNYNSVRFVFTVALALIVGAIYWGLGARRCASPGLHHHVQPACPQHINQAPYVHM